ncbi:hypothetical protein ILUMI_10190 [Ignelater luminosus]|uniref:Chitin-binding type-2 domain-containing protein n=1 Tax=Ignelater luminosus TaxID=2038154 RepID=A0A8K0D7M4_IGNLU|nr:hypothetical protein ILUMI_10190 [Ignelater luminosus]
MKSLAIPLVMGFVIIAPIKIKGEVKCPQVIEDPPVDILFPHEFDCSRFYKCSHGVAREMDCPGDLYFNPDTNYCDWRFNVNCTNDDSSENHEGICPPMGKETEDDIMLPHDSDCSKYFQCSHGKVHEKDCPTGLYFNQNINRCDWPSNVNCTTETSGENGSSGSEEESSSTEQGNSQETDTCPSGNDPERDVLLPHESDCTKFYKCSHGEKHEVSCADGLYFNPTKRVCDWPENVNCTTKNKDDDNGSKNIKNKSSCPWDAEDPKHDVLLPHDTDCSKFYMCTHGEKVEMPCPSGLHFNPDKNYCDYPGNVKCAA